MARHRVHLGALAALGAAAAFLLAGCGSAGGPARPSGTGTGTGSGGTHGAQGKDSGCGDAVLDLAHVPDGGVCVGVGRTLTVRLAPGKGAARESGDALARVGDDVFHGVSPGAAELSGAFTCPPPKQGEARCMIVGTWRVAVEVR